MNIYSEIVLFGTIIIKPLSRDTAFMYLPFLTGDLATLALVDRQQGTLCNVTVVVYYNYIQLY